MQAVAWLPFHSFGSVWSRNSTLRTRAHTWGLSPVRYLAGVPCPLQSGFPAFSLHRPVWGFLLSWPAAVYTPCAWFDSWYYPSSLWCSRRVLQSLPHPLLLHLCWHRLFCMRCSCCLWKVSFPTVLTLPCVLSPFRFHGFALSCTVSAHLRFALPAVRYSMEHTFDYTVTLFGPSATPISELCLLRPLLTSHSSLLLRQNCRLWDLTG